MKFNIIALLYLTCFLNLSLCFLRHNSPDTTLIGNDGIRFMQKANTEEENKEKSQTTGGGYKYNAEITVVKETDPEDTKPEPLKGKLEIAEHSLNYYDTKGKIQTQVSFLE